MIKNIENDKEQGTAVDRKTTMKTVRVQVGWMASYKPSLSHLASELAAGQGE